MHNDTHTHTRFNEALCMWICLSMKQTQVNIMWMGQTCWDQKNMAADIEMRDLKTWWNWGKLFFPVCQNWKKHALVILFAKVGRCLATCCKNWTIFPVNHIANNWKNLFPPRQSSNTLLDTLHLCSSDANGFLQLLWSAKDFLPLTGLKWLALW